MVASLNALKSARDVPMKAALDLIEGVAEPQTFGPDGSSAGPARVGENLDAKA